MEMDKRNLERRESALTVVCGAIGTVLSHWEDIDPGAARELLTVALGHVEELVRVLEDDLQPIRDTSAA